VKLHVTFGKPRKVSENKPSYVILRFPFTVRQIGDGSLLDVASHHSKDVEICYELMTQWRFGSTRSHALRNPSFVKTLFAFAQKEVTSEVRSGEFREDYPIRLECGNRPTDNPYDPATIPNPEGFSFEIEQ
jgi:hypothetical protein